MIYLTLVNKLHREAGGYPSYYGGGPHQGILAEPQVAVNHLEALLGSFQTHEYSRFLLKANMITLA